MLMVIQGSSTKLLPVLCLRNSHSTDEHYIKRDWEPRKTCESGKAVSNAFFTLTLRSLTLYIYGAPILDVSRSHTTTQHSR